MYIPFGVIRQGKRQFFVQFPAVAARKSEINNAYKPLILSVKLTCFLLLAGLLHVSARTVAQTRISLSLKGVTLEKAFAEIEKRSGYTVFYNVEVLRTAGGGLLTLDVKDATIEDVMHQCLKGLPLGFSIQDKTIFVKKEASRAELITPVAPKPQTFSGVVKEESGVPLAGATVLIAKLKKSALTDMEGQFVIKNVPDGEYEVEISYIGYEPRKLKISVVNHEAWLAADLKLSESKLDETVVKGYYSTTNRFNTGDVTTVTGEAIQEQPVSDPVLALEGRVPGLYIQQTSGIPGAYSQIQIMGQNSIANGNDPLYIIDGVPFSSTSLTIPGFSGGAVGAPSNPTFNTGGVGISPFNSLNPSDIESIVVLKDADATAIYGSRGANGVILISTKKGKFGATRVDLNVYTGSGQVTRMMHMLNTTQYLAMRREAFLNDGLVVPSIISNPTDNNFDIDGVWDTSRYTNWQKTLIRNAATFTNAQASVSGGTANTQFLVGGGYSKQGTPYIGGYYDDKIMGNASITHTSPNQKFHLQLDINYVQNTNKIPFGDFTQIALSLAPDAPALFDKSGNVNWQIYGGNATWSNPAAQTYQNAKAVTDNLITNLNLSYEIIPGLKVLSTFGYNHDGMQQTTYGPAISAAPPYNTDPSFRSALMGTTTFEKWIAEPQINFQKNLGVGHIETLLGTTFEQNTASYYGLRGTGYPSDALIPDLLAASTVKLVVDNNTLYRYNAVYGRVGYNWNEEYLINLTARRDGSSRFGSGKQFGNFGAIGVGWIFSKEDFVIRHLPFVSYGKLRGSYGITGNDQISDYQYLSSYSPTSGTTYDGTVGLSPTRLANPFYAWEVIKKLEGGIDLGFEKNRILISAIYYRNRTGNQLVGYSLPYITGFNTVQFNLPAIVQNNGIEITLNTSNIKSKTFSWTSNINLTIPSNKLVAFPNIENFSSYANTYVVGKSLFSQKLYHYAGVNDTTGVYEYASGKSGTTINPIYPTDLVVSKPITQQFYGGFGNSIKYKGFQLDIFLQFVKQRAFKYFSNGYYPGSFNANFPTVVLQRWQKRGDMTNYGLFSTQFAADPNFCLPASDFIVGDASFIRFKNLALSYQLPGAWQKSMHFKNVRLYLLCQNLLTITKYLGMDPETGALTLPPLRMITGGLQASF